MVDIHYISIDKQIQQTRTIKKLIKKNNQQLSLIQTILEMSNNDNISKKEIHNKIVEVLKHIDNSK